MKSFKISLLFSMVCCFAIVFGSKLNVFGNGLYPCTPRTGNTCIIVRDNSGTTSYPGVYDFRNKK